MPAKGQFLVEHLAGVFPKAWHQPNRKPRRGPWVPPWNAVEHEENNMSHERQKFDHVALAQAIKDSQDTFLLRTELFAAVATELKAKHDALVNAGFTPEQALELCKSKAM